MDAGSAILDYVSTNAVDHIVLGARTSAVLRNILGSVSIEIVQKAPCTVTVVRKKRAVAPRGQHRKLQPRDNAFHLLAETSIPISKSSVC